MGATAGTLTLGPSVGGMGEWGKGWWDWAPPAWCRTAVRTAFHPWTLLILRCDGGVEDSGAAHGPPNHL